jgi:hypothetical protein
MRVAEVRQFCKLDEAGDSLVRAAMSQLNLSAGGDVTYRLGILREYCLKLTIE